MSYRQARGIALMTSLLISVFLLVLSISLFEVMERDNRFTTFQNNMLEAYYLARSGIEFYKVRSETFVVGVPVVQTLTVITGGTFSVVLNADGSVRSTGSFQSINRTLEVRNNDYSNLIDVGAGQ